MGTDGGRFAAGLSSLLGWLWRTKGTTAGTPGSDGGLGSPFSPGNPGEKGDFADPGDPGDPGDYGAPIPGSKPPSSGAKSSPFGPWAEQAKQEAEGSPSAETEPGKEPSVRTVKVDGFWGENPPSDLDFFGDPNVGKAEPNPEVDASAQDIMPIDRDELRYLAEASVAAAESDRQFFAARADDTHTRTAQEAHDAWQQVVHRLSQMPQESSVAYVASQDRQNADISPNLTLEEGQYLDRRIADEVRKLQDAGVEPGSPQAQEITRQWHETLAAAQGSSGDSAARTAQGDATPQRGLASALQDAIATQRRLDQERTAAEQADRAASNNPTANSTPSPAAGREGQLPAPQGKESTVRINPRSPDESKETSHAAPPKQPPHTAESSKATDSPPTSATSAAVTGADAATPGDSTRYVARDRDLREYWLAEAEYWVNAARDLVDVANRHERRVRETTAWLNQPGNDQHPLRETMQRIADASSRVLRTAGTAITKLDAVSQDAHRLAQEINRTGEIPTRRARDIERAVHVAEGLHDSAKRTAEEAQYLWGQGVAELHRHNQVRDLEKGRHPRTADAQDNPSHTPTFLDVRAMPGAHPEAAVQKAVKNLRRSRNVLVVRHADLVRRTTAFAHGHAANDPEIHKQARDLESRLVERAVERGDHVIRVSDGWDLDTATVARNSIRRHTSHRVETVAVAALEDFGWTVELDQNLHDAALRGDSSSSSPITTRENYDGAVATFFASLDELAPQRGSDVGDLYVVASGQDKACTVVPADSTTTAQHEVRNIAQPRISDAWSYTPDEIAAFSAFAHGVAADVNKRFNYFSDSTVSRDLNALRKSWSKPPYSPAAGKPANPSTVGGQDNPRGMDGLGASQRTSRRAHQVAKPKPPARSGMSGSAPRDTVRTRV